MWTTGCARLSAGSSSSAIKRSRKAITGSQYGRTPVALAKYFLTGPYLM
jgi:hypothetical protein